MRFPKGCRNFRFAKAEFTGQGIEVFNIGQRWQVVEITEIEIIEKFACGGIHCRPARYIFMAHHANPLSLHQGFDDLRAHRHTTNIFNVTARNRLAIGNQGQGFQQGARVSLRLFFPQPANPGGHVLHDLEAKTAGDFTQLKTTPGAAFGERSQRFAQLFFFRPLGLLEQVTQILDRQRFAGGQQGTLNNTN